MHLPSGSRQDEQTSSVVGWQGRLSEAGTAAEVLRVAREFVARITPGELQQIPEECRPTKIVDEDDISRYALILVQRSCAGDRMADRQLQRMASFFTRAALRLAQINAHATTETEES